MTVIWGYLHFCWFMLDFDKYECYNLPNVITCPGLSYKKTKSLKFLKVYEQTFYTRENN